MCRGTGFRGLAGIWPSRRFDDGSQFASPLLCCTRAEIVSYLRSKQVTWREDTTNADCAYARNFIRHRLLPSLQKRSGDCLVEALARLTTSAKRLDERVRREAGLASSRHTRATEEGVAIDAPGMAALPELVAVELIRGQLTKLGCGERDLTRHHYQALLTLARANGGPGALTLPGGFVARRKHQTVVLRQPVHADESGAPNSDLQLAVPGVTLFADHRISTCIRERPEVTLDQIRRDKGPYHEYLDLDRVELPLLVRRRRVGDRFHPLGAAGEKKVGKFLTTAKVPEKIRKQSLIFADAERIIWVCPIRISESARVVQNTRRLLELSVTCVEGDHDQPKAVAGAC